MQQKLENITVDAEDFRKSAWKSIIELKNQQPHMDLVGIFGQMAKECVDADSLKEGKVFWLLGSASSMVLRSESINEPFKPFMIWEGKRSTIPDDFCEADVEFFGEICEEIDDDWLRGRLADLVWLLKKPRNRHFALIAIDAYRSMPLNIENWYRDGFQYWGRAVALAKMLRGGAGNRLAEMESSIISTLHSISSDDSWSVSLSNFLNDHNLGNNHAEYIAYKLESVAKKFVNTEEYLSASDVFDVSTKWFKKAGKQDKEAQSILNSAEMLTKNAEMRKTKHSDYGVAAHFYERAIQKYRSIPANKRREHQVECRIDDLFVAMRDAGEISVSQMTRISMPPIDISQARDEARNLVQGKSLMDAFKVLANIYRGVNLSELRRDAEKIMQNTPLLSMISSYRLSSDGRTVAKSGGARASETTEEALHFRMMENYRLNVGLAVQGMILPVLSGIQLEHRLSERNFLYITQASPIVPEGRELLFAKGLFAGYDNDFVTALHLVVPQIEHMVRWFLKKNNVQTTTLDATGIEMEIGLSSLMKLPAVDQLFDENLAFELKALFCDALGANLRNEVAHGLLDGDACDSLDAVYAWWLAFRLVFNSYCYVMEKLDKPSDSLASEVTVE